MKRHLALAAIAVLLSSGPAGAAKPADKTCLIAGWENPASVCAAHTKVIAATCFNCHGPQGESQTAIPPLAGKEKQDFIAAMREFRDGKRENTVMHRYALGYTEDEYEALGDFFANIK